jgi:signal peptidase
MGTSLDVGPSPLDGAPSSLPEKSETIYLGNELDIDLWFKGETTDIQSVLIRATTPDGVTKSSFIHINGGVQQIPVFDNEDPLTITDGRKISRGVIKNQKTRAREFTWSPEKPRNTTIARRIAKISSFVIALIFFASALTGITQLRVVLTGSMKPAINPGDLVVAVNRSIVTPQIGKVVLYSARDLQGNAVTIWSHRIIAGDAKQGFTIKGDANSEPDIGPIPLTDIQSVVVLRVPYVGHLFNIYSLLLIFGGLILISVASPRRKRE